MCWSQEEEEVPEVEKVQRLIDAGFSPSTSFLWPVRRERSAPTKAKLRTRPPGQTSKGGGVPTGMGTLQSRRPAKKVGALSVHAEQWKGLTC